MGVGGDLRLRMLHACFSSSRDWSAWWRWASSDLEGVRWHSFEPVASPGVLREQRLTEEGWLRRKTGGADGAVAEKRPQDTTFFTGVI